MSFVQTFSFISKTAEETAAWASRLADLLQAGDVLALDGDLGAGKTTLVSGLARRLGVKGQVASPTFTFLRDHEAGERGTALYHFDAYRLSGVDEWYESGFDEYITADGITAIEWAQVIREALPPETISITLERLGTNERRITVNWSDARPLHTTIS